MCLFRLGSLALFVTSGLACHLGNPASCGESPVVETQAGPLQGFDRDIEEQTVSTFWAIPFAQPPVGSLRFHYPVPDNRTWTKPKKALSPSATCPQAGGGGSEDCLYLNVYAPRKTIGVETSKQLPVMFWIYGGGYSNGDSYMFVGSGIMIYDGGRLAGRHDVVVVTSNYRLNALGFNTYTTGSHGQTGTQAIEDQRLAMKWTHENINGFGGDPARVTIFGESAGAFSTMVHLVASPSWRYFSKAIMESGISQLTWFFQPKELAIDLFESWAEAVGCETNTSQLSCLQALPMSSFTDAPKGLVGRSPAFPAFPVGPVIDGNAYGLLDMPATLVKLGLHHRVPLILGSNEDGGTLFEPMVTSLVPGTGLEAFTQRDVDRILNWTFTVDDQAKISQLYRPDTYGSLNPGKHVKMVSRVMRDLGFMCSDRLLARQWRKHGFDAYLYTFDFNLGMLDKALPLGDCHGADVPFVWRSLLDLMKLLPLAGDVQWMADIMTCQWATFAYSGSPNGGSNSSQWPPNCRNVHGKVQQWPVFAEDESYYSLQASHIHGGPKVGKLRLNNTYPDDERPSNVQCDMWDTVNYPWHSKKKRTVALIV